mgnify:CR=1 FL=1
MNHIMISFPEASAEQREKLMALLSTLELTGFEEADDKLIAYAEENNYDEAAITAIAEQLNTTFSIEAVSERNWNEEWEKNFEPVVIDGFCSIRADFHAKPSNVTYDIVITPKMSFGTGHHATTASMISLMRGIDFAGKEIFDFGTGTGILAILAEQLGATKILAIDNDEWSYVNAVENCERNKAQHIEVQQNVIENIGQQQFDIILANINRHILLAYMKQMSSCTKQNGILLLSGILSEDVAMIRAAAEENSFVFAQQKTEGNWVCMQFTKK